MGITEELKSIRKHIDEKNSDEAWKLIEICLARGFEDYFLYIFAGTVTFNQGKYVDSQGFYKKAIKINEKKVFGWKGLLKLYEGDFVKLDSDALEAARRVADSEGSDASLLIGKFLLKMGKFDLLFNEESALQDVGFCKEILSTLVKDGRIHSEVENNLCEKCVAKAVESASSDDFDEKLLMLCLRFKVDNAKSYEELCELLEFYASKLSDPLPKWVSDLQREVVAANYLNSRKLDITFPPLLKASSREPFDKILTHINASRFTEAFETCFSLSAESRASWPLAGLVVPLCLRLERYEVAVREVESRSVNAHRAISEMVERAFRCAHIESVFGVDEGPSPKLTSLLNDAFVDHPFANFVSLSVECRSTSITEERFLSLVATKNVILDNVHYWKALFRRYHYSTEEEFKSAYAEAKLALNSNADQWRSLLLLAELLLDFSKSSLPAAKDRAVLEKYYKEAAVALIKAASLNPFSGRTFWLLGEAMGKLSVGHEKAVAYLKRSFWLRPDFEPILRSYLTVLGETNAATEQLTVLRHFVSQVPSSVYGLRRLTALEHKLGKMDDAVLHANQLIRLTSQNASSWSLLGDVYVSMGNLQSAKKAYAMVIDLKPDAVYERCKVVSCHRLLGEFEEALIVCEALRGMNAKCSLCLYGSVLMSLAEKCAPSRRLQLLVDFFTAINSRELFDSSAPSSCFLFELVALALTFSADYDGALSEINFPSDWKITKPVDALRLASRLLQRVVAAQRRCGRTWNNLALILLHIHKLERDNSLLDGAAKCAKVAIRVCTNAAEKSVYYTNLASIYREMGEGRVLVVQHCLLRALQLNNSNEKAWCSLGLLYADAYKFRISEEALRISLSSNPEMAFSWCALGMLAESGRVTENAADLLRHSLLLKPTVVGVTKYAYDMLKCLSNGVHPPLAAMFDFETVNELLAVNRRNNELRFFVALMAECSDNLGHALFYINSCNGYPNPAVHNTHRERIYVAGGDGSVVPTSAILQKFRALCSLSVAELREKLKSFVPIKNLFDAIELESEETLTLALSAFDERLVIPLLVSLLIIENKESSESLLAAVRKLRLRSGHALLEVFPADGSSFVDESLVVDPQQSVTVTASPANLLDRGCERLRRLLASKRASTVGVLEEAAATD